MDQTKHRPWLPAVWCAISCALLALDFATGPFVGFPIAFVIPVALAARYNGRDWGIIIALLLAMARFGFTFLWAEPWSLQVSIVNLAIRLVILVATAVLIDRVVRQRSEIKKLRGILPTCCVCKKIRTDNQRWIQREQQWTEVYGFQLFTAYCENASGDPAGTACE